MIERFTPQQFEAALPKGFWQPLGWIDGEYCYIIRVTENVGITIRSSIDHSGIASDRGENSIRFRLVDGNGEFLGGKLKRWVTREPGWQERMVEQLRAMWKIAKKLGTCPKCGAQRKAFKVKKQGPNKGRMFMKCDACQAPEAWEWLEE